MPRKKRSGPQPEQLVRLTFEYRDGEVRLVSRQSVEMTLPAEPVPARRGGAPEPGLGVQLRDAADRPVFHRTLRDQPLRPDAEVFAPGGEVRREELPRPEGAFTVLVPAVPDAEQVVLIDQPPPAPGKRAGPPAEVARFSLADVPDDDDDEYDQPEGEP